MKRAILLAGLCLSCMIQTTEADVNDDLIMTKVDDLYYTIDLLHQTVILNYYNQLYTGEPELTIPSTIEYSSHTYNVTGIDKDAFWGNGTITFVSIPENIVSIEEHTFHRCKNLKTVSIPKGVTSIGEYAFSECESLTSASIPDGVKSIGEYAFSGCESLTFARIPDGMKSIGKYAFSGCESLKDISIPESVTSIGEYAFSGCKSLAFAIISDGVKSIEKYTFYQCESLTFVTIPSYSIIGEAAFAECTALKEIQPALFFVDSFGDMAFRGCKSLLSISLSGATSIGKEAFAMCSSLFTISIPFTVAKIGQRAFAECGGISHIYLEQKNPAACSIGSDIFYGVSDDCLLYIPEGSEERYGWAYDYIKDVTLGRWQGVTIATNSYFIDPGSKDSTQGTITVEMNQKPFGPYNEVIYGTSVSLTAYPVYPYRFEKWEASNGVTISTANPYKFAVKEDRGSILASFVLINFSVSLFADKNGSIMSGKGKYEYGNRARVEAEAAVGYHFVKWTDAKGDSLSANNPYIFVVTSDTALHAHFAADSFKVSLSADNNGTITSGEGMYSYNAKARLEVEPESGYHLAKWTNAQGDSLSASNPYLLTVKRDTAVKAHLALNSYRLSLSAKNGSINTDTNRYAHGAEAIVTAVADAGYYFASWTNAKGEILSNTNPYTFVMMETTSVTANFTASGYEVKVYAGDNGRYRSGSGRYAYNTMAEARVTPEDGYHILKWTNAQGDSLFGYNPYTFAVTEDTEVWAHFAINSYRVELTADNGSIESGNGSYTHGAEVQALAVTDKTDYRFEKWTDINGNGISTENPYTFIVTGNTKIRAHFTKRYSQVNLTVENGRIKSGGGPYTYNTEATVEAEPIAGSGYYFVRWTTERGDSLSSDNPYTFVVTEDVTIHALFWPFITVDATEGGHTTEWYYDYDYKVQAELTATADSGYLFTGWMAGDSLNTFVSADNPLLLTLTQLPATTAYRAAFEKEDKGTNARHTTVRDAAVKVWYADGILNLVNLGGYSVTVTAISGRKVLSFRPGSDNEQYPAALPAGVYILTPFHFPAEKKLLLFKESQKFVVR
ncbi:hypothetical protein Barb6_00247 [Bacteroidales bacterium Barb6]|nr:hypothetical protein Barb6_00247 [Bacteroidales bacterium Barb6]